MDELGKLLRLPCAQIALDIFRIRVEKENLLFGCDLVVDDSRSPHLPRPLAGRRSLRKPFEPGITSPDSGSSRRTNSSSKISASVKSRTTDLSNVGKRTNSTRHDVRHWRTKQAETFGPFPRDKAGLRRVLGRLNRVCRPRRRPRPTHLSGELGISCRDGGSVRTVGRV